MAAPIKDIAGKTLKVGDTILVPALVPATVTAVAPIGANGHGNVTCKLMPQTAPPADEFLCSNTAVTKWSPPEKK